MAHERAELKNAKVFTMQDQVFGVSTKAFLTGLIFSAILSISAHWWSGFLFAVIYFPFIFKMYKDDPNGLSIWWRAVCRRQTYWRGGTCDRTCVIIICDNEE